MLCNHLLQKYPLYVRERKKETLCDIIRHREITAYFPKNNVGLWQFLSKAELLNKLLTCEAANAVTVMHTPALYEKLTFTERLQVLCRYEPFAIALYNNKNVCNQLKGASLAAIGKNSYTVAFLILNNIEHLRKLQAEDIVELASNIPDIAKLIINKLVEPENRHQKHDTLIKFELLRKLNRYSLVMIGKKFAEVANIILSDVRLMKKMAEEGALIQSLAELSSAQFEVAQKVLSYPLFRNNLSSEHLRIMGENNFEIFHYILNTPELKGKLAAWDLAIFGKNNPELAKEILSDSVLYNKLDSFQIARLSQNNIEIAEIIFNNPGLSAGLDGFCLGYMGQKNPMIAQRILNDSEFCSRLKGIDLSTLGEKHFEVANSIIKSPNLCARLDGFELAVLGQNHLEIAGNILNNKELRNKLDSQDLFNLGYKNTGIAKIIFKHEALVDVLEIVDLCDLASDNIEISRIIFNSPKLLEKITDPDALIGTFCQGVPEIVQLVVSKCEAQKMSNGDNDNSIFKKINDNQSLYQSLKDKIAHWEEVYQTCLQVLEPNIAMKNSVPKL